MEKIEVLRENIEEKIEEEIFNKKLLQSIKDEFIKKGLNTRVPDLIWKDEIDWERVTTNEYIALASGIRYELGRQKAKQEEEEEIIFADLDDNPFALKKYFTEGEIKSYHNLEHAKIEEYDSLTLRGVTKIDEKNYHCIISAEQLSMCRKNQIIVYNKDFQRASRIVKSSRGVAKRSINVNKRGVIDLTNRFLKGDIKPTSITLCVLVDNEAALEGNFKFNPQYEDFIGDMFIRPNVNAHLPNEETLELNIPDGFHRYTGICNAFDEAEREGEYLDYKLGCFIHIMTRSELKQYIADVFKRNETSMEYLKSLEETDENKFVSNFEQNSKWLKDHVASTRSELKLKNKYVTRKTLIESFRQTDINMDTEVKSGIAREKTAKILDNLLNYINETIFEGDLEKMQDSVYLCDSIFRVYVRFSARMRNEKSYNMAIDNLVEYINNNEENFKKDISKLYIAELLEEVTR